MGELQKEWGEKISTLLQNQIWRQIHPRVPADAFFIALCVKISFFWLFLKSISQVKNSFNWVQRIQHTTLFKGIIEIKLRHPLLDTIASLKMIEVALLSTEGAQKSVQRLISLERKSKQLNQSFTITTGGSGSGNIVILLSVDGLIGMRGDSSVEQTRALKVTRRSALPPDCPPPLIIYHNYSEQKLEPAPVQIFHHVCFPWTCAPHHHQTNQLSIISKIAVLNL